MPDDFAYRLERAMRQVARDVGVESAYPPTALRAKVASTELMNQLTRRADYNRWTDEYLH